jgi:His-Xaa-Ser system protein HxsD
MTERDSSSPAVRVERSGSAVKISIDESIYSREAILRAAHWYTDRAFVALSREGQRLILALTPKTFDLDVDGLAAQFENSLLDAQLRVEVARETAAVRELIVAKAFAEGDLLDDKPSADWRDPVASPEKGSH